MTIKEPKSKKDKLRDKAESKIIKTRLKVVDTLYSQNGKPDSERTGFREIGKRFGKSHTWVADVANLAFKEKKTRKKDGKKYTKYIRHSDFMQRLARNKPGPKPRTYSQKRKAAKWDILETKAQYPQLGAAKINAIAGFPVSAPTAHSILMEAGFEPVSKHTGKVYKRFEMPYIDDMWQIDYVELGTDKLTGKKVESLSVIDDHSRYIFSANARISATTDDVIEILESIIAVYGCPKAILSDHGTQWAASNGGDTRFDRWCEDHGIVHIMGQVRKPTTQGKVERWHGSMRREAGLPEEATLEQYQRIMTGYVRFYNEVRPHWACDLKTPKQVYERGCVDRSISLLTPMLSFEAVCSQ